mmetsp:Transcript_19234/g.17055  ORF Transcript_19234/g.17055 Transcript_19234/m.17055 type:complete len:134 (+) Transcript_19234:297-698(+)
MASLLDNVNARREQTKKRMEYSNESLYQNKENTDIMNLQVKANLKKKAHKVLLHHQNEQKTNIRVKNNFIEGLKTTNEDYNPKVNFSYKSKDVLSSVHTSGKECFISENGSSDHSLLPIYKINQSKLKLKAKK